MKNGKMTYEEFESLLKKIKKSKRPDIMEYLDRIKTEQRVQYKEDNDNDTNLISATEDIFKKEDFALEHVMASSVATGAMTLMVGALSMAIAPAVAVFSQESAKEYLKTIGTAAGTALGSEVAISLLAAKFHSACANHQLKKELKNHLKTKFSNQVKRDVEGTGLREVPNCGLRLVQNEEFTA